MLLVRIPVPDSFEQAISDVFIHGDWKSTIYLPSYRTPGEEDTVRVIEIGGAAIRNPASFLKTMARKIRRIIEQMPLSPQRWNAFLKTLTFGDEVSFCIRQPHMPVDAVIQTTTIYFLGVREGRMLGVTKSSFDQHPGWFCNDMDGGPEVYVPVDGEGELLHPEKSGHATPEIKTRLVDWLKFHGIEM